MPHGLNYNRKVPAAPESTMLGISGNRIKQQILLGFKVIGRTLKAHTHRPIFRGFLAELAVELADSIPETADYATDSIIVIDCPYQTCLIF